MSFATQGAPAVSIQWGPWSGAGMAGRGAIVLARFERIGLGLLSASAGLRALGAACRDIRSCKSLQCPGRNENVSCVHLSSCFMQYPSLNVYYAL